jgi:hypothetical protein
MIFYPPAPHYHTPDPTSYRISCAICHAEAKQVLGFSAPMRLPGQDDVDFSNAPVVALRGMNELFQPFQSIYEMEGNTTFLRGERTGVAIELPA